MAEVVTGFVKPIMEELGRTFVSVIKRQFNYLCCFTSNIQSLREEFKQLKDESDGLQNRVNAIDGNTNDILPVVETWLKESKEKQIKSSAIEDEIKNVIPCSCMAIKSRFLLSRKVKKTADDMKVFRKTGNFKEISTTIPIIPASKEPIPEGTSYDFDSRTQIEEDIKKDLKGGNVHMVGIWGMGGVGKTTMAKRIANKMREENLFDEVVMAVVSQEVRMEKIQGEIAAYMGFQLEDNSLRDRAKTLSDRLKRRSRILLVLDDIWKGLKLEDLGIPCRSDLREGCKIILTSRSIDVLKEMKAQRIYKTEILDEAEPWSLFRNNVVGTWVDDSGFLPTVKEVAEECKGLPLALIIVGTALKYKRDISCWRSALEQLKRPANVDIPLVLEKVYKPIKLSYDLLGREGAQFLFLLCCMFPEDSEIHLEYLTMYAMGLHMFKEIRTLGAVRDRVWDLLLFLKDRSLLLDGRDMNHVKMHDVIRDVARFIASKVGQVDHSLSLNEQSTNCTWISVVGEEKEELPIGLRFPKLRLLLIDNYSTKHETNNSFFQEMKELNVLSFSSMSFRSLPETTNFLQELRTLYLVSCSSLVTISIVGELPRLEILICRSCNKIVELSAEIGNLKRLKLLEVSDCGSLARIEPGVLSKLIQLEELIVVRSFKRWETKVNGKERNNATLCELKLLPNLVRLEIEIEDATLAAEEICLHPKSKISKYKIKVGAGLEKLRLDLEPYERSMLLNLEDGQSTTAKWIHVFLKSTSYLFARGNIVLSSFGLAQAKVLNYKDCSTVKKLVNIEESMDWNIGVLPHLESLNLSKLPCLEEICDGPIPETSNSFGNLQQLTLHELPALQHLWKSPHQNVSDDSFHNRMADDKLLICRVQTVVFGNLEELEIIDCNSIKSLFSSSIVKNLVKLNKLIISKCNQMVKVIEDEETSSEMPYLLFPSLVELELQNLPKLQSFCNWRSDIEFISLETVFIKECPLLESFSMESACTPNMKSIGINSKEEKDVEDLNVVLRIHFAQQKKKQTRGRN